MKHFNFFAAVLVFILTFSIAQAQETSALENSVLWKVEHPELTKPSYIFGTVHLMCESDFSIPEKVKRALQDTDALVLEVNLSDPNEIKSMQEAMSNSKKISEELSKEQYTELDKLITEVTTMHLSSFDSYGLIVLNSILLTKMLPCTQFKVFENELTLIANKSEKPVYSLEKASEQMAMMKNAFPPELAFQQMMLFKSYKKDFNDAITAYKNEDLSTTVNLLTKEDYMDKNTVQVMQIDRNMAWVEKMPGMMKERSNLFAVGAAHLTNDFGIINLLREKGYTVTPVLN